MACPFAFHGIHRSWTPTDKNPSVLRFVVEMLFSQLQETKRRGERSSVGVARAETEGDLQTATR